MKMQECGFAEQDKRFIIDGARGNGFKTSFTELYSCFHAYIAKKNNLVDDEPCSDDDE